MRDYLLDTQMIRYWYDTGARQHTAVVGNIATLRNCTASATHKPRLLVSVITLGEIAFGHGVQLGDFAARQEAYTKFVDEQLPDRLELTEDAVNTYGEIRTRLFNAHAPGSLRKPKMRPEQLAEPTNSLNLQIQENDLWLCAQAAAHDMILVTNDAMHPIIAVVKGMTPPLSMQNWTVPDAVASR